MSPQKRRILLWLGIVALALLVLAASLPELRLQPGIPLPGDAEITSNAPAAYGGGADWILLVIRGVIALAVILLPISIFYNLKDAEGRRRLLSMVLTTLMLIWFLTWLSQQPFPEVQPTPTPTFSEELDNVPGEILSTSEGGIAEEKPPETNPALEIAACAAAVVLLSAGLAWLAWRASHRREAPFERLAEEARFALTEIDAGGDIRDIIIRCYLHMTQVLVKERGVFREAGMTAHEFERVLCTQLNLPARPVQRLTRLFERARYSNEMSSKRDELEARDALAAIIEACKQKPDAEPPKTTATLASKK